MCRGLQARAKEAKELNRGAFGVGELSPRPSTPDAGMDDAASLQRFAQLIALRTKDLPLIVVPSGQARSGGIPTQ